MRKFIVLLFLFILLPSRAIAQVASGSTQDSDSDGLSDLDELNIYHTDPNHPDTDQDGFLDGSEIKYNFDPNVKAPGDKLIKHIEVDLKKQELTYGLGSYIIKTILVSTGTRSNPTPKGYYKIGKKIPVHLYRGSNYYFPNTRWNMQFATSKGGNLYIHGAYWHNNFGKPMSHGCVNVSYTEMEPLYNWADSGTVVTIK